MQKLIRFIEGVNYWTLVLLPFSVGIAPGFGNTVMGIMLGTFFIEKLLKREKPCRISLPLVLFSIFIVIGLVSFKNSSNISDSVHGITKLLKFLLIFIVYSEQVKDIKHFKRIVFSAACIVSLLGIDAIWQVSLGKDFIRGNALQDAIGLPRATASFPGCNGLGVFLTSLTPLVFGLAIFNKNLRSRIFFSMAAILGGIGVGLTLSRGAGLGLFISLLLLSFINKNKVIVSALIILLLVFPFVMPKNIRDWAKRVNYNPVVMLTCETRIGIYRNTLKMISHHPFIGIGINTFSRSYGQYRDKEVEKSNPTADGYYAHNNFLHMAGEVGILGLGVFLVFLFVVLKGVWVSFRKNTDPFIKGLSISVFAAIIAYLINGLTETSLYYSRIVMIFWFLIGLGLALARSPKEE